MEAATIERWISVIEDNDFIIDKDKRIENLINLWKFSGCCSYDAHVTDEALLSTATQSNIQVTFTDMCLKASPKSNYIRNIYSAITPVLNNKSDGAYYIEQHEQKNNFTATSLLQLEEEIINAIQGKLVTYNQVKKITKLHATPGIYTNVVVKDCNRNDIINAIQRTPFTADGNTQWLVLVLDRLVSQCDSFYISDDVLHPPFTSGYDKLFLFDFYKGEVLELSTCL
ncbi:hypothetical protein FMM05_04550 [Flavobacterium zepuense]|uniref:Uncharacterized protein n=1 Tax=Flavobacterium zepuense TaxID=2593302 RepID=A0A552V857_9FLAO|nr:hypothetical protein [Flavobacterium zepuense]TRW26652.1 hypothetical protein FMM05_04550 [Flavobacterium zepuense]